MDKPIVRTGFYASLVAFAAAFVYSLAQVLQVLGLIEFPLDAIVIYSSSLCIATPFVLAVLALHYIVLNDKKFWSHAV